VREYVLEESAYNGKHRTDLNEALHSARLGEFQVLLVWALDRLSREGVEATLAIMRQFRERGAMVWSMQLSWTETSDARRAELLASIFAWMAAEESRQRSERVKAAIAVARQNAPGPAAVRIKDGASGPATTATRTQRARRVGDEPAARLRTTERDRPGCDAARRAEHRRLRAHLPGPD